MNPLAQAYNQAVEEEADKLIHMCEQHLFDPVTGLTECGHNRHEFRVKLIEEIKRSFREQCAFVGIV